MSASNTRVTVAVRDGATGIAVVDGQLQPVGGGFGHVTLDLAPGLYRARSRVGADAVQQAFVVEPGTGAMEVLLDSVRFVSPIPIAGTRTARESQEAALRTIAGGPHVRAGSGGACLLFVRDPEKSPDEPPPAEPGAYERALRSFALRRTDDGEPVVDLRSTGEVSVEAGYAIVRAELAPGTYVLSAEPAGEEQPHFQAVSVVAGRRTEIFVRCERTGDIDGPLGPVLDDLAIVMPALARAFDPRDGTLRRLEVARQALRRGRRVLEPDALRDFIEHAADDPMLALYAAHLARYEAGETQASLIASALEVLVKAWGDGAPDLAALRSALPGARPRLVAIDTPPMLWPSWQLAVRAGARARLVSPLSLAEGVAGDAFPSGDWLAWDAPVWLSSVIVKKSFQQAGRLRKAESSFGRAPRLGSRIRSIATEAVTGWIDKAVGSLGGSGTYLSLGASALDLDRLSTALVSVPWETLARPLAASGLTTLQRALLPTLVAVRQAAADPDARPAEPQKVVAAALADLVTTDAARAEAVVGLLEAAAVLQQAEPANPALDERP